MVAPREQQHSECRCAAVIVGYSERKTQDRTRGPSHEKASNHAALWEATFVYFWHRPEGVTRRRTVRQLVFAIQSGPLGRVTLERNPCAARPPPTWTGHRASTLNPFRRTPNLPSQTLHYSAVGYGPLLQVLISSAGKMHLTQNPEVTHEAWRLKHRYFTGILKDWIGTICVLIGARHTALNKTGTFRPLIVNLG